MANVSQGATVTWAGVSLGEVVRVTVDGVQADTVEVTPRNRLKVSGKQYSVSDKDNGTISVTCRGVDAMSITNVGVTGTLTIGAPAFSLSFDQAIFQQLGWSASVGEMQTYSVTFKIGA